MDQHASPQAALDQDFIASQNAPLVAPLTEDYEALARTFERRGIDIEVITEKVSTFAVATPSWAVGTGGTRFARFPIPGEPRDIFDKIEDCAVVHRLSGATPTVSLHFPWDETSDMHALREQTHALGLGFDAVNSNTFQDHPGNALASLILQIRQPHPYRPGSARAGDRA